MRNRNLIFTTLCLLISAPLTAVADELLYAFESDTLPQDAGWLVYDACDPSWCAESVEDGHFVLQWEELGGGAIVNYSKSIALLNHGPPPPLSLWVEYRFRSNRPLGPIFDGCDGEFATHYQACHETLSLYGDTAFTYAGDGVTDLLLDEFYTARFESPNGTDYWISINGRIFTQSFDEASFWNTYLQMRGNGGCNNELIMQTRNEWDFVRYGSIGYGESIIATDPPIGFLDPSAYAGLDRFTVTYDSPNYAYIDDISVVVSGGDTPIVIATRRLDNGPSEVLEIVLDRPLPATEHTMFTFNDGAIVNTVAYTFQHGDVNADGRWDLRDFAPLQSCFGANVIGNACSAFDYNSSSFVEALDCVVFVNNFNESP